jgi:hypothetical protein
MMMMLLLLLLLLLVSRRRTDRTPNGGVLDATRLRRRVRAVSDRRPSSAAASPESAPERGVPLRQCLSGAGDAAAAGLLQRHV